MVDVVGMGGLAPKVRVEPPKGEVSKYLRMWEREEYRRYSPGEERAMQFLKQSRAPRDSTAIDFGCGTGRGALMLALMGGLKVTMLDFAGNCLDPEVREATQTQADRIGFIKHDLTKPIPVTAVYGYCCDVMEHIPTEDVPAVLRNILNAAQHVYFNISTTEDGWGKLIGETLHMTVRDAAWWARQLLDAGALIHWSDTDPGDIGCSFYCTSWKDARDLVKVGRLNVDDATVDAQAKANIEAGWSHALPHGRQDREVVVLCGGPSMNDPDSVAEIKRLRAGGAALVTMNGSYGWALAQGLEPSVQIVVDAREFNARFTRPVTPYTKYLIASQVHPSTLEGLPRDRTFLWHCGLSEANEKLVLEKAKQFFPIPGGSTVTLRAIPLLRMLGFWRLHLFGFDSCVRGSEHHAYAQPENDRDLETVEVVCNGQVFQCSPWQVSQASEFRDIVRFLGDEVELAVYGDGLIAAILREGAELSTEKD